MTLSELIQSLVDMAQEINPMLVVDVDWLDDIEVDPEIRYASQPSWPFEHQVGGPVLHDPMVAWDEEYGSTEDSNPAHPDHWGWLAERATEQAKPKTVFLHETGRQEYLRGDAAKLLGWR